LAAGGAIGVILSTANHFDAATDDRCRGKDAQLDQVEGASVAAGRAAAGRAAGRAVVLGCRRWGGHGFGGGLGGRLGGAGCGGCRGVRDGVGRLADADGAGDRDGTEGGSQGKFFHGFKAGMAEQETSDAYSSFR
jgi:hypothetical protein